MTHNDLVALLRDCRTLLIDIGSGHPLRDKLDTALTALHSGEAVLCPREPTDAMCSAAANAIWLLDDDEAEFVYRAMLDCAKGKPC